MKKIFKTDKTKDHIVFEQHLSRGLNILYLAVVVLQIVSIYLAGRSYLGEALEPYIPLGFIVQQIDEYMLVLLMGIFFANCYLSEMSLRRLALGIVVIILLQYASMRFDVTDISWVLWLILCYPNELKIRSVLNCVWRANAILIMLVVFLSLAGLAQNNIQFQHSAVRQSLGFCSPNALGVSITMTLMVWCITKVDTWRIRNFIFGISVLVGMYAICNSRAALTYGASFLVVMTLRMLLKNRNLNYKVFDKVIGKASCFTFPICFLLSIALICVSLANTESSVFTFFNDLLSGRLLFAVKYYQTYDVLLYGQQIATTGMKVAFGSGVAWSGLDCAYLMSPLKEGLLATILILILMTLFSIYNLKTIRNSALALMIIVVAFYCLTENMLWDVSFNILLPIAGAMLRLDSKPWKAFARGLHVRQDLQV